MNRSIGYLLLAMAAPMCSADAMYMLHVHRDPGPPTKSPRYIDDAEVRVKIPSLAHIGPQIDTCYQGMARPNRIDVTYPPTITAPHHASTNVLNCSVAIDAEIATCTIRPSDDVVFGDAPKRYFALGADTPLRDAIAIADAFHQGTLILPKGLTLSLTNIRIREISRRGSAFRISRADCGCSATTDVQLHNIDGKLRVEVIADMPGVCI